MQVETLAGGDQDLHLGRGLQDFIEQPGARQQVFEVVHHQQQALVLQEIEHLLARVPVTLEVQSHGCRQGWQDSIRVCDRRQGHEEGAVRAGGQALPGGFQGQAGFAHPAHAQDGHQARLGIVQQARKFGQFGLAAYERSGLGGQVVPGRGQISRSRPGRDGLG